MSKRSEKRKQQRNKEGKLCFKPGEHIEDGFMRSRIPKNESEALFCKMANQNGWLTTKRGWPDFFCVRGDKVCCVEVKPSKSCTLKQNQIAIMGVLAEYGIHCYLWSPDGGFETVKGIE